MAAASVTTEPAIVSIATRHILSVLVTCLLYFLQVTSATASSPGIPDMVAYTGKAFIASFRSLPVYGNPSVNVQLSSSASSTFNRLHSWFTFNTTTRTISGLPLPEDVGWTLLTITTDCSQVTNLEDKDTYTCTESSDQFKLTVHTLSWSQFLAPRIKSTESIVQSSVGVSSVGDISSADSTSGEHGCGEDRVVASLVLCVSLDDLNAKDRFHLVVKLSDFLSIPTSSIMLESSLSQTLGAMVHGFQMVSAGPGSGDICSLVQNVELVWELPCATVKHLTDFLRVFQHNVDGGRLADEISATIIGWYVASSNPLLTKHNRRRRGTGQHTVVPTPVLTSLRPTTVVLREGGAAVSSLTLSSPVVDGSSSTQLAPESHEDSLTQVSSSVVDGSSSTQLAPESHEDSLTQVSSSISLPPDIASAQTLFSSSVDIPWTVLHPSPSGLDALSHVQTTVMQEPVSSTSHPTSTLHLEDSILSTFIPATLPQLPDRPTLLYPSIVSSELPLSGITIVSRPEPASVIASESSDLLEDSSTRAVLSESEQLLPSGLLLPSSRLPSLSLLLLDSDIMVTSRTVEIIAFPFTSIATESSFFATPSIDGSAEPSVRAEFSDFAESSTDTESSGDLELSVDAVEATIPQYIFEYSSEFEPKAAGEFQSKISDILETGHSGLLTTQLRSQLVPSTLSLAADTDAVDTNMTVTPSRLLLDDISSILDTITVIDIGLRTDQVLTESVTEGDISHTPVIEDGYTSVILHTYSLDTVVQSIQPTLNTSSEYEVEASLEPAATLIMPSMVSSISVEWGLLSELTGSLTTVIATSFTSATAEFLEAQQSTSLSLNGTESAVVEETVEWIPTLPTDGSSSVAPTDDGIEANHRPFVQKSIKHIVSQQGRLLRFLIPHDVFIDREDGNTSSLTLSLMSGSNQELPSSFWLYLESGDQTILTGLPLQHDMSTHNLSILLVATDKEGLSATDSITVQIVDAPRGSFTHVFIMKFALDYQQFMHNRRNLPELLHKIAEYFDDSDTQFMTVLEVSRGSLVLSWTNNTLTGAECQIDIIKNLLSKMVRSDGTVKSPFYRHVGSGTNLTEILFEPIGSCYVPPTTTIETPTTYYVSDTSRAHGLSVWAHVILPVMIAVLVFVLIILIIVFCNRRRRHRQAVLNVEKEAVSNDRNPIFFPDELEVDDSTLKAREPIVLPTDPHPNSQSTPPDLSPSKNSTDQERTSNQDPVDQEWVTQENPETEQDLEKNSEQKRRRSSKKHKEQGKDGGVSASSTLTWDRPNNHYLEEEASSRSSTLNSTKSLGSEKRHPKNPPPYWQSQSDPPPYRLPPPYLTETTSQV